jgi:crotonobetainyl-CoA:carnitine CoA-transferase CaiB-like acyl-CoA transferase
MLLGDLGAEVIKVERPGTGDPARFLPGFFRSINRNKKSLTLDLKKPAARHILYRLVERADVLTEGFRPGVAGRLEIGYDRLREINPRLIYCSISGYGQDGPYRDLPGHDLNYMAMSGMLTCFRDGAGNLFPPGVAIGDLSSGMFAVIGILAALMAREKTDRGQYIDVSMFDGLLSWMSTTLGNFFEKAPFAVGHDAGYGIFKGSDGKAFTLGIAHENWFWDRLCTATGLQGLQGLGPLERRQRRAELVAALQDAFSKKTRDEWVKVLVEADVPAAPAQDLGDVAGDPHVAFREMIRRIPHASGRSDIQVNFPIKLSDTPAELRMPTPDLGEHNREILQGLGYSASEIEAFKKEGVI